MSGRRRWRMSHRASPKRWWRPRWVCSRRFRRWLPTTVTRMTSTDWPRASRVSPKSSPTCCIASHEDLSPMRTSRRTSNRLMNEINVVPYIDVMLVLLVIFMVTAPLMNPGQIDLPQVGKSWPVAPAPLEVIIKKDTTLAMRDHSRGGKEIIVSRENLIETLKARQGEQATQAVVISADRNVRYEEVINVMNVLQQQQIRKVGLLTQVKAE